VNKYAGGGAFGRVKGYGVRRRNTCLRVLFGARERMHRQQMIGNDGGNSATNLLRESEGRGGLLLEWSKQKPLSSLPGGKFR